MTATISPAICAAICAIQGQPALAELYLKSNWELDEAG